jgi:hypothetical protein
MCKDCEHAKRQDVFYFVKYYCKLANNQLSESVDTYFNQRDDNLIECPLKVKKL